jgi:hypothetical protein
MSILPSAESCAGADVPNRTASKRGQGASPGLIQAGGNFSMPRLSLFSGDFLLLGDANHFGGINEMVRHCP